MPKVARSQATRFRRQSIRRDPRKTTEIHSTKNFISSWTDNPRVALAWGKQRASAEMPPFELLSTTHVQQTSQRTIELHSLREVSLFEGRGAREGYAPDVRGPSASLPTAGTAHRQTPTIVPRETYSTDRHQAAGCPRAFHGRVCTFAWAYSSRPRCGRCTQQPAAVAIHNHQVIKMTGESVLPNGIASL